jgi:3-mercaptopyruvate sulfurtransferase SseA
MRTRICLIFLLVAALVPVAFTGHSAPPSTVEQVPRLKMEQVKDMLGRPDVVMIDIRYIKQYEQSDKKIPGAVFVQPEEFDEFAKKYPKDKTYILY